MSRFVLIIADADTEDCIHILTETNRPDKMIKFIKLLRNGSLFEDFDYGSDDTYIELFDVGLHNAISKNTCNCNKRDISKHMIEYLRIISDDLKIGLGV